MPYEVCVTNAPLIHMEMENGLDGSYTVCTYICLYIYMCKKVFRFQTTRHIWSAGTDSLGVRNRTRKTREKPKESKSWRAPRGKVQVCYSSCASLYKTATTLLSTRQVQGWPSPPCSLVNKEGLIHWQESLFNQWRNALYSELCFCFIQLVTSLHVEEEQPSQCLVSAH